MGRRQLRTRALIFDAFSELLNKNKYNSITVQDIIDKAGIGRSTFYSHFETKDELLNAVCHTAVPDNYINILSYAHTEIQ